MILAHDREPEFTSGLVSFVQALVYKNKSDRNMLLAMCTYKEITPTEHGSQERYHSIDIIEGGGKAKGILLSTLVAGVDYGENRRPTYLRLMKGQASGGVLAFYVLMDWIGDNVVVKHPSRGIGSEYLPDNTRYILINGSNCLIDPRAPLRYGLASAFDNDPATSYVENTEDDLMLFTFYIENSPPIRKMAVINGYAQNIRLYQSNNRIKRFISSKEDKTLDDGILSYQYISENIDLFFRVKEIYKGNTYNDTCLAELNFLTGDGWLFGGIDE
jgi:hypothetical protein